MPFILFTVDAFFRKRKPQKRKRFLQRENKQDFCPVFTKRKFRRCSLMQPVLFLHNTLLCKHSNLYGTAKNFTSAIYVLLPILLAKRNQTDNNSRMLRAFDRKWTNTSLFYLFATRESPATFFATLNHIGVQTSTAGDLNWNISLWHLVLLVKMDLPCHRGELSHLASLASRAVPSHSSFSNNNNKQLQKI